MTNSITLSWNSLMTGAETGGKAIQTYLLEYKEATTNVWAIAAGGMTASQYFLNNSTTVGSLFSTTAYEFRVSAINVHG